MRMLDFGCGNGGFEEIDYQNCRLQSWLLLNEGHETYAIDINPLRIDAARRKINNGTHFAVMDGRQLAFPDNYFDVVHEWAVFHHMTDFTQGIKEIHRVLKPGGKLILCESTDNDPVFRFCRRVFGKWHDDDVSNMFTSYTLDRALLKHFQITSRYYHWRFIPSDFLRQYQLEPRASLFLNEAVSRLFNKFGLGEKTCCHYVVNAVNYKKK